MQKKYILMGEAGTLLRRLTWFEIQFSSHPGDVPVAWERLSSRRYTRSTHLAKLFATELAHMSATLFPLPLRPPNGDVVASVL